MATFPCSLPASSADKLQLQQAELLERDGQYGAAVAACLRVIMDTPTNYWAHLQLGKLCLKLNQPEDALAALRMIPCESNDPTFLNVTAIALQEAEAFEEGLDFFSRALQLAPRSVDVMSNMSNHLYLMAREVEAAAIAGVAANIAPQHSRIRYNHGLISLSMGKFADGWAGYEYRWELKPRGLQIHDFPMPRWQGEPLDGRTILLYGEQGHGDAIQFLRFLPRLHALGARTFLMVRPPMVPLAATIPGVEGVVTPDQPLEGFDFFLPIMSLPFMLGLNTEAELGMSAPYIHAPEERAAHWRTLLPPGPGLRVGLVWSGSPHHGTDHLRSIPVEQMARHLSGVPGVRLFGLQKNELSDAPSQALDDIAITDLSGEIHDFTDSAGALANLDLLISVDTAIVHLAGAMGCPAWVLLPFAPDWRWQHRRADSPWYPSVRLFRQPAFRDWETPLSHVAEALRELAAG